MVRGLYTGASGMVANLKSMDSIANNLSNVNTIGYKKDNTIFKSFPEMLIRRFNDNGVHKFPLGSWDSRPVVGKLGTGVEVNEVFTNLEQSGVKKTENKLDLALDGKGFFVIKTDTGEKFTRNGEFTIDKNNFLVTKRGEKVLGENGYIKLKTNNFTINSKGEIYLNKEIDKQKFVQMNENAWDKTNFVDTLKLVDFKKSRYLKKVGNSFFTKNDLTGEPILLNKGNTKVLSGSLETSNVNPVKQMVKMIEVQRSYEANQKTIKSHDELLSKLINEMGSVR